MANIKWTGIESYKYGLTARWYVSAYYGNDIDVDGVGYYNPSTNVTGHGGPTRPFATISKLQQYASVLAGAVVVFDSGWYTYSGTLSKAISFVGDGNVTFANFTLITNTPFRNCTTVSLTSAAQYIPETKIDVTAIYCTNSSCSSSTFLRCIFIESSLLGTGSLNIDSNNNIFVNCSGTLGVAITGRVLNNFFINCSNLIIPLTTPRPTGVIVDYSIIIGTVRSNRAINGKTTGVTIEDFKIDGTYFVKSYSEVDLFGNASGSGASVTQLQTIFNNYFSPIYLDTYQDADLSLKPDVSDIVKFGGLNGTYIGALPVGYRYSAYNLYNTYIDAANSSNLAWNAVNNAIVIADGFDTAVYRSIRITLPVAISCDPINFFANLVYNIEGTAKQGVANQRIDTTPDLEPNNTFNQRVVYDFKLAYAANDTDPLSDFKNFELNSVPYIDNEGESMLDDNYDLSERQKPLIRSFMIEFTLRKIIIA